MFPHSFSGATVIVKPGSRHLTPVQGSNEPSWRLAQLDLSAELCADIWNIRFTQRLYALLLASRILVSTLESIYSGDFLIVWSWPLPYCTQMKEVRIFVDTTPRYNADTSRLSFDYLKAITITQ